MFFKPSCWPAFLLLLTTAIAQAQSLRVPSNSELPFGCRISGVYQIEIDDANGHYLKEDVNGLVDDTLDMNSSAFYFWLLEDVFSEHFYIYSSTQQGRFLKINPDSTTQWTSDPTEEGTKLFFQMLLTGPARTDYDSARGVNAMGIIRTREQSANYGNSFCKCNFLIVNGYYTHFLIHRLTDSPVLNRYAPVGFKTTNPQNTGGSVTIDNAAEHTKISQLPDVNNPHIFHNFVSSDFFITGIGEDDLKITIDSGSTGRLGFLEYTQQHYKPKVYSGAKPKLYVRAENDTIYLGYLSGNQPYHSGTLVRELRTDLIPGQPFTMGFIDQNHLVVSQNNYRDTLNTPLAAEQFLNQSITSRARLLLGIKQGSFTISHTRKNGFFNSKDTYGTSSGDKFYSTDVYLPYSGNDQQKFLNTFDWQQTKWKVRFDDGAIIQKEDFSPFYQTKQEFTGFNVRALPDGTYIGGEDFSWAEGWELIKANLGYNADGSPSSQPPKEPYIMFYDRISSILRVFVYLSNVDQAQKLGIQLSAFGGKPVDESGYSPENPTNNTANNHAPRLWGSLQQFASLDKVVRNRYEKIVPFPNSNGRNWYHADFVMEYDPCIAFFESTIKLSLTKTTQGGLTMVGRMQGGNIPAGSPEYGNWLSNHQNFTMGVMNSDFGALENTLGDVTMKQLESFNAMSFSDSVNGLLVGKKIEDWEKENARIQWEASSAQANSTIIRGQSQMVEGAAKITEGVGKMGDIMGLGLGSSVEAGAKIAQGVAKIANGKAQVNSGKALARIAGTKKVFYDNIKDKVKHTDQKLQFTVPPPRPNLVFGELALKGTLSMQTDIGNGYYIATPGALNTGNTHEVYGGTGSRAAKPLYNQPMGNITLLKQPEFAVGIAKSSSSFGGFNAWLKIKEKPYFACNDKVLGKVEDVISIGISVETLDKDGTPINTSNSSKWYTCFFGNANSNPQPAEMDITELIDWAQIEINMASVNHSDALIQLNLEKWIEVSYVISYHTITNLKSRDLKRVAAQSTKYYTGLSSFKYASQQGATAYRLKLDAKALADNIGTFNFANDANFLNNHIIYHSQFDGPSSTVAFYNKMQNYCNNLHNPQNPSSVNGVTGQTEGELDAWVDNSETEAGGSDLNPEGALFGELPESYFNVFPNPARNQIRFKLVSQQVGKVEIGLYNMQSMQLIKGIDELRANMPLEGKISFGPLSSGTYVLKIKLPDGETLIRKIIKH